MQSFSDVVQGERFQGGGKFSGKLVISQKWWEIQLRLLLIT